MIEWLRKILRIRPYIRVRPGETTWMKVRELAALWKAEEGVVVEALVTARIDETLDKVRSEARFKQAADDAFLELDNQDRADVGLPAIVNASTLPVIPHPCRHFSRDAPNNFRGFDVIGSCKAQGGRPCMFNHYVAKNCPVFQAATAKR